MPPRWVFWLVVTLISWGIWAILGKEIEFLSAEQSQLLSTVGLLPVLGMLSLTGGASAPGSRVLGTLYAFGAGVVSSLGNIFFYQLLRSESAVTVIPLTSLAPLVTVLLAIPVLHERLNGMQILGIAFSLAAIYLFSVKKESGVLSLWLLWALAPICLWGVAGLLQKMATNNISAQAAATWFLLAFFPLAIWLLVQGPWPTQISTRTWALAAALGFTLAFGNYTVLMAYASGGKASIIAPLSGLYPLVSIPIAVARYGEEIDVRKWLGIFLAVAAVITLSLESPAANTEIDRPQTGPIS